METITLNNGKKMPLLGFGVFQVDDLSVCEDCVYEALKTGYRLIDTAATYGNEEAVGRAIKRSGIPRDEIFVTTKVWIQDAGYDSAKAAFEKSMKKLDLDYLDLYLIHRPFGDYYGSWRAMEELYKEGRIKSIGVSNFTTDRLIDLVYHHEIVPAVNQIETHPFCQQNEVRQIMEEYNIIHESWAPFAEGMNNIFVNPILKTIADKYGKTTAQVILRWQIQRNTVVIPKSIHSKRIRENFEIWDFELSSEDMMHITDMDLGNGLFRNNISNPDSIKHWCTYKIHE